MNKEAEILKTFEGISYHYTLLPKSSKSRGHVSQVCRSYKN